MKSTNPMHGAVKQWGNSLAIRLPKPATDALDLTDGSALDITISNGAIILTPKTTPTSLDQLISQVTPANRHAETRIGPAQ